jgi:hypothetical protein
VQQPRAPAASQVDGPPQPLITFSKEMSCEQLAVWLTNHPQLVGADYQQDISKLKGIPNMLDNVVDAHYCRYSLWILDAKVSGRAFLSLNESRLERSGVSLGFQCSLMDVIENLVCDIHLHPNPLSNSTNNSLVSFMYRRGASRLVTVSHNRSLHQVL